MADIAHADDSTIENMRFIVIIPARYGSTRFPGKPLALLGGKTVIRRVCENASLAMSNVLVATDDERILSAVHSFGGKAVMTSREHRSGTDRCWEAFCNNGGSEDVIINIQGDEPFIDPRQVTMLMECFDDPATQIATLVKPFPTTGTAEQLHNPNTVKVVLDANSKALYFSRSVVPFLRGVPQEQWPARHQFFTHLGMYAYRAEVLERLVKLPPSSLETAESLEQLRWLQNGFSIMTRQTDVATIGIDTPDDLRKAEDFLRKLY